ncbi:MAG: ISAs1 family transposase [Dysgonamonadaceae bacterium]|nr:ISAs1 family transposase [Dysgonamonadaceae bacterium]
MWKSLSVVIKIEDVRYIKYTGKEEKEPQYYITNYKDCTEVIDKAVRSHWSIENQPHWQLDVSFSEDQSRKQEGYATQNISLLNRMALNLIKQEVSKKKKCRKKRPDAGLDNDYLIKMRLHLFRFCPGYFSPTRFNLL